MDRINLTMTPLEAALLKQVLQDFIRTSQSRAWLATATPRDKAKRGLEVAMAVRLLRNLEPDRY